MKITVNLECSPEEARNFMGLPDVKPIQDALMKELEQRMVANMQAMDPQNIARAWMPASLQGIEQLQKMFWNQLQQAMSGTAQITNASERKTGT